MDGCLVILHPFQLFSVISLYWVGDNERGVQWNPIDS